MNFVKALSLFRKEAGAASVEIVLLAPMLFLAGCQLVDLFLGFRANGLNYRAAYAVADSVSRIGQHEQLDRAQLEDLHDLFQFIVKSDGDTAIRVTVVKLESDPVTGQPELNIKFSEAEPQSFGRVTSIDEIRNRIPIMGLSDEVIITQTHSEWEPVYIDIGTRNYNELIVSRPRFTQTVTFDDGGGGGVGTAPGGPGT